MRTSTVQWRPDNAQTLLSSGVARIDPPAGTYPDAVERRQHQIAITGLLAPTEQLDGTLLSSSFPALIAPAVAVDIYTGDTGLDSGRPQSLYTLDPRLIDQHRITRAKRVNLRIGQHRIQTAKRLPRLVNCRHPCQQVVRHVADGVQLSVAGLA